MADPMIVHRAGTCPVCDAGDGHDGPTATAAERCKIHDCPRALAFDQVVLVRPSGENWKLCGPYCTEHRDQLRGNLREEYTGGGPAYRLISRDLRNFLGLPDRHLPKSAGGTTETATK